MKKTSRVLIAILFGLCCFVILKCNLKKAEKVTQPFDEEEVMKKDLSSLSGEYINAVNEKIILNEKGLREHEIISGPVTYVNGVYYASIHLDNADGGYALAIYPPHVEVPGYKTNTNTLRIYYGQAEPTSINQIYTKQ